jgi:ketosteroid isomerase-like protein
MKPVFVGAVVLACWLPSLARAQDTKGEDPAHEELRTLRKAIVESFNKRDIDGLLKHVHKDVVVTWQNGEVSRGHDGVKKYFDRMLVGDKSVVVEIKADPQLPELSSLYGGKTPHTAVAYGTLNDHYKLRDGMDFKMNSLFSAVLVKENGQWSIVNFHASTNVFDNEVLHQAIRTTMIYSAGAGLVAGLLIATVVCLVVAKMRKA